jgi:hypothetical protein
VIRFGGAAFTGAGLILVEAHAQDIVQAVLEFFTIPRPLIMPAPTPIAHEDIEKPGA